MSFKFFLLKYGRSVVLTVVSLVNVPGLVANPTVNCLALVIPTTLKFLLNPLFWVALVLLVLFTFKISTLDPTLRLWGS